MKLDYKKTIYVGLAFFIITIFWQTYDTVIARILIDKFGLSQLNSGIVMALDNILALILLPVFGALSDRSNHKKGRRTPFVIIGTIIGALAFMGLSFVDNMQSQAIDASGDHNPKIVYDDASNNETYVDWGVTVQEMYEYNHTDADFIENIYFPIIKVITTNATDVIENNDDPIYKTGNITVRDNKEVKDFFYLHLSHLSSKITQQNTHILILFLGILLVALVSMSFFRSPAVALMPDVTIKPLRSKANAVINLMGSFAAMFALGFLMLTKLDTKSFVNYWPAFIYTGVMMLIVLFVFINKVNEPKLVLEKQKEDEIHGIIEQEDDQETKGQTKLEKPVFISLMLILSSVFLWFMGYNAVISKVSDYAPKMLNMGSGFPTIIAHAVAIVSFIPIGKISSKIGRKKAILIGITILAIAFGGASLLTEETGSIMYLVFAFVGIGWATINVNSFPMVVELAKGSDVGRYTGYYYFFSMAAQIVTPILSGFLMDEFGRGILFIYSAIFVASSFATMFFVKHGDSKPDAKKGLEAFDVAD